MKKKIALLIAAVLVFLAIYSCNKKSEEGNPAPTPTAVPGYKTTSSAGITFNWKINGANMDIILMAPTTGWVSCGFNSSAVMNGANFIIGYVSGGSALISDEFGSGTMHSADTDLGGTDNLSNSGGNESGGNTQLNFTIPLNSGDSKDFVMSEGTPCSLILAYGPSDNFTTKHTVYAGVAFTP